MSLVKKIYFDNNSTTCVPDIVCKEMIRWLNKGNPSSDYDTAKEINKLIDNFRNFVIKNYGLSDAQPTHRIIFTSGASESNCTIIKMIVDAFNRIKIKPHIVVSSIEHKSIIKQIIALESDNLIEVSYCYPNANGHITLNEIKRKVQKTTKLICVMHANNETGAINDIISISHFARKHNILFHCDTVQTFGKYRINLSSVDSVSVSAHKFNGPKGIGMLIINKYVFEYLNKINAKLVPIIHGEQNYGLRGGTENVSGIASMYIALKLALNKRIEKNAKLSNLKLLLVSELSKKINIRLYSDYINSKMPLAPIEIILLSDISNMYLPNTLMLSVVKYTKPYICNVRFRRYLQSKNIIISVGSACNTHSIKASHVLDSMKADNYIKRGTLRISFGDFNNANEVIKFVNVFLYAIKSDIDKILIPPK